MRGRPANVRRLVRSVWRALVVGAVETFIALVVAFLNPFHIDEWASDRSRGIWQRIMADGYECRQSHTNWANGRPCPLGRPDWPRLKPSSALQGEPTPSAGVHMVVDQHGPNPPPITVFYLDEQSLDNRSHLNDGGLAPSPRQIGPASHTLSLSEQEDLLQDVADARMFNHPTPKPVAIFVDLIFDDAGSNDASAARTEPWLQPINGSGRQATQDRDRSEGENLFSRHDRQARPIWLLCSAAWPQSPITANGPEEPALATPLTKLACISANGGTPYPVRCCGLTARLQNTKPAV